MSNLEPEIRSAIESRIDQELARRAIAGSMVYFALCVVVGISTPYYMGHPVALLLGRSSDPAGRSDCASTPPSACCAIRPTRRPGQLPVFKGTTYATFVVWGLFCAWTLHWYAGEWTGMFLLLCTAVLAGGASHSLAPDLNLATGVWSS